MYARTLIARPLWLRAQAAFARARAALGAAAHGAIGRAARGRVLCWLAPLEALVRKLLFAEAARISLAPALKRKRKRLTGAELAALAALPRRARFCFAAPSPPPANCAPSIRTFDAPRYVAPAPSPRAIAPPRADDLARRFDALAHVLAHPLRHARRLGRLIARVRRRFPEIALRYAMAPARRFYRDQEDPCLAIEACSLAIAAAGAFADSS